MSQEMDHRPQQEKFPEELLGAQISGLPQSILSYVRPILQPGLPVWQTCLLKDHMWDTFGKAPIKKELGFSAQYEAF